MFDGQITILPICLMVKSPMNPLNIGRCLPRMFDGYLEVPIGLSEPTVAKQLGGPWYDPK